MALTPEQRRQPKKRIGGQSGTTRTRTPYQIQRQGRVFELSLRGWSAREIAAELNIDKDTVCADLVFEQELRAEELGSRRETEKARSVAVYERVIRKALERAETAGAILDAIASGADMKLTDRYLETVTKARERIDKVLGVDAPTKVDIGIAGLLEALEADLPE